MRRRSVSAGSLEAHRRAVRGVRAASLLRCCAERFASLDRGGRRAGARLTSRHGGVQPWPGPRACTGSDRDRRKTSIIATARPLNHRTSLPTWMRTGCPDHGCDIRTCPWQSDGSHEQPRSASSWSSDDETQCPEQRPVRCSIGDLRDHAGLGAARMMMQTRTAGVEIQHGPPARHRQVPGPQRPDQCACRPVAARRRSG